MSAKMLFLTFFMLACQKQTSTSTPVIPIDPLPTGKTWLALGDSYTIGQGVTEIERFPYQTALWLAQNGKAVTIPDYIATTGWTTGVLTNNVISLKPSKYDIVSLLIGVNDQYQTHDTTGYRQKFSFILEKAITIAKGVKEHVYVLSIPDYSVTPFAAYNDTAQIRKEIDLFNSINRDVTNQYKCNYLGITASTREAKTNRSLLAADGLHPSGIEYKKWAERLGPLILGTLK